MEAAAKTTRILRYLPVVPQFSSFQNLDKISMMFTTTIKFTLLLLSYLFHDSFGWGARYEMGGVRKYGFKSFMVSNENHRHHEVVHEDSLTVEALIHYEDFVGSDQLDARHVLDLVRARADELAAETFAAFPKEPCVGEECDAECLVPEEWTSKTGDIDASQVMDFLGIRRAQPLRLPTDWE